MTIMDIDLAGLVMAYGTFNVLVENLNPFLHSLLHLPSLNRPRLAEPGSHLTTPRREANEIQSPEV